MALENDTQAPDFDLANQYGEHVRLSDFRGVSPVALVFFPLAFSSTCTGELCALPLPRAKIKRQWVVAHLKAKPVTLAERTFMALCEEVGALLKA